MATAPLSHLLEVLLLEGIRWQNWASGVSLVGSMGGQITSFPAIRVSTTNGSEEPPNSGNFNMTLEVQVFGRVDPDNASTYTSVVNDHVTLAGNMQEYLTDGAEVRLALEENAPIAGSDPLDVDYYTNTVEAYNIRLVGFDREIDSSEALFEDKFYLEVYLMEAAD
jgi:hypothetical protein